MYKVCLLYHLITVILAVVFLVTRNIISRRVVKQILYPVLNSYFVIVFNTPAFYLFQGKNAKCDVSSILLFLCIPAK